MKLEDYNISNKQDKKEFVYKSKDLTTMFLELDLKKAQGIPENFPMFPLKIVEKDDNGFTLSWKGLTLDARLLEDKGATLVCDPRSDPKYMRVMYQLPGHKKPVEVTVEKPEYPQMYREDNILNIIDPREL